MGRRHKHYWDYVLLKTEFGSKSGMDLEWLLSSCFLPEMATHSEFKDTTFKPANASGLTCRTIASFVFFKDVETSYFMERGRKKGKKCSLPSEGALSNLTT